MISRDPKISRMSIPDYAPTLASEQAVILYVQRTAGAIGYMSGAIASDLPSEVRRVLTIR